MPIKTRALKEAVGRLEAPKPLCVEPKDPLKEVYAKMREAKVGAVLVCRGKKLVGIFTERDLVLKTIGDLELTSPIEKAMTKDPFTVTEKTPVGEAVERMHAKGIRNLPILDEKGRPIGILTVRRVMKYLAAQFPDEVYNLPPKPGQVDVVPEGA